MTLLKKYLYPLILLLLCIVICVLNYTPGTFFTGWDTLHPEFNFSLNFSRVFSGVWRQEQGLGAVAGHSHMADLVRIIYLFLTSFIFKLNFLRYSYIFLCFIVGPIGFYFLAEYLFIKHPKHRLIAFLSALFYIFNLSTLQQFYVAFEMFTTQYALLPFVVLFTIKYLHTNSKKSLFLFSLFTVLATPQAYAAHLWYAFFGIYLAILFFYFLLHRTLPTLKKAGILIALTFTLNSFWLLPNIYFIKSSSQIPKDTKVNRLFSQEYRLQNRTTGYLRDVALVKGFYFNWKIYNHQNRNFDYLTEYWNKHLTVKIQIIGFTLFLFATIGLVIAFVQKNKTLIALSPAYFIPFILLINHTPPFDLFFDLLIKIPILEEAFRFIFTKISIVFSLSLAIYIANFIGLLFDIFTKKTYQIIFSTIFVTGLIIFCFPFFQGQLIHPFLRIKIPDSYFQLWKYSQSLPQGTVLPLPLNNFTGWQYYGWNYQGSGLIWFGLKQNILDRDFDRWSTQNEEAYRELFYTLYSKDTDKFYQTIEKFNLNYILWDLNVITNNTKNEDQITFKNEIKNMLDQLETEGKITLLKKFDNLVFYKVNNNPNPFRIKQINNNITPKYQWQYYDQAYFDTHDYITDPNKDNTNYLYRNLINKDERIINPHFLNGERIATLDTKQIDWNKGQSGVIDYLSTDKNIGSYVELFDIDHETGIKVGFESRNIKGMPLRICIKNLYNNLCMIYEELSKNKDFNWDYFIVPPMDNFSGYSISLDNIPLGNYPAHNQLRSITVDKVDFTSYLNLKNKEVKPDSTEVVYPETTQFLTFFYQVINPKLSSNKTIIFSKPYNPDWSAFYFKGLKLIPLKNHILVNNWANGWETPTDNNVTKIYFIFWPQIYEFFGFGLLISSFITILKKSKRKDN